MYYFLVTVWIVIVALLHAIPGSDLPKSSFLDFYQADKLVHALIFAMSFFFIVKLFSRQYYYQKKRYIIVALILYGLFLECCQGFFFVDRSMDVFDWLADSLGVFMAALGIRKFPVLSPYIFKKS